MWGKIFPLENLVHVLALLHSVSFALSYVCPMQGMAVMVSRRNSLALISHQELLLWFPLHCEEGSFLATQRQGRLGVRQSKLKLAVTIYCWDPPHFSWPALLRRRRPASPMLECTLPSLSGPCLWHDVFIKMSDPSVVFWPGTSKRKGGGACREFISVRGEKWVWSQ